MEKQEVKSKWDELARQLGAEVSVEAEQLVEATAPPAESQSLSTDSSAEVPQLQAPKRRAAGWDSLANEFGLPTPPPSVETVDESRVPEIKARVIEENVETEIAEEEIVSRGPRRDNRPRRQEQRGREDRPRRQQQREREDRPPREEHARRGERPRREDGGRGREKSRREHRGDRREHSGRQDSSRRVEPEREPIEPTAPIEIDERQFEETPTAPPAAATEERTSRGAAVSLWQKIFGSPIEQTSKLSDAPSIEKETYEASRDVDDLQQTRDTEIRERISTPTADQEERQELVEHEDESSASDDGGVTDRKRRRRRGRRRRGGRDDRLEKDTDEPRRRRPDTARRDRDADDQIDDLATDDDELDSDASSDDDITDESSVDANGESTGVASRRRSALQRSIPSWDEAIGFIVESNMQSRSQRRQSPHPGSRSQSPRNRGRGRHKK